MKTVISTLVAATAFAVVTPAMAENPYTYRHATVQPAYGFQQGGVRQHPVAGLREINLRQEEQRARIDSGFRRGAITRWEFRRLMAEHQDIQAMERAFVADGFLSPRERLELHRRLDLASQHIVFEARDRERRF